jgi:hypothetical protein
MFDHVPIAKRDLADKRKRSGQANGSLADRPIGVLWSEQGDQAQLNECPEKRSLCAYISLKSIHWINRKEEKMLTLNQELDLLDSWAATRTMIVLSAYWKRSEMRPRSIPTHSCAFVPAP